MVRSFFGKIQGYGASAQSELPECVETVVSAHSAKSLRVGIFSADDPAPQFKLSFEPHMEKVVGASLERLETPNKPTYALMYDLINFGDRPCRVTVRRLTPQQS